MATILTPIGQTSINPMSQKEIELVNNLRTMLKDLPDEVFKSLNNLYEERLPEKRWSDQHLLLYLQNAVADINSEPPHTHFSLDNYPPAWKMPIIQGAMIFALISEGILQNGEQFSYSDNGISLTVNIAQGYQSIAQMLLNGYIQLRQNIKRAMRPNASGIKSSPAPYRIRAYAPRMWTYR